jgi:ABC-type glycerol-3-phosphate transport system substrate-binding protein
VTIEVWWLSTVPALRKQLIEAYKKVHRMSPSTPTIASSTDMNQKLTVALAAGTGPEIMDADASYYVAYHAKGVLEPANLEVFGVKSYDELAGRYVTGGLASGTFDGKIYTLPYQGNSMSLFINNKLFAEAGLAEEGCAQDVEYLMALCRLKKVDGRARSARRSSFPTTARAGNSRICSP